MEKQAQQVQWQNGVQSSCCGSDCEFVFFAISVFAFDEVKASPLSAQGIMLSANTRKAMRNANNFIGCKGK
jgi:hypothetical protein